MAYDFCPECRYYEPDADDSNESGYCCANPPQVFKMLHDEFRSVFPMVLATQRACRHFRQAPEDRLA